jgi:hypothetical protein
MVSGVRQKCTRVCCVGRDRGRQDEGVSRKKSNILREKQIIKY